MLWVCDDPLVYPLEEEGLGLLIPLLVDGPGPPETPKAAMLFSSTSDNCIATANPASVRLYLKVFEQCLI